jgi:hypothetical protein
MDNDMMSENSEACQYFSYSTIIGHLRISEVIANARHRLFDSRAGRPDNKEVRFDLSEDPLEIITYTLSFIPENRMIPPTKCFNLKTISGDAGSLEKVLYYIFEHELPESIRIIRSDDKKAYAIFVNSAQPL